MSRPVRQAVILAAGMGTRLSATTGHEGPKGFLWINGETLIARSIRLLQDTGIDDIVIVTGYQADRYEALAARSNGRVRTIHNPLYDRSGSMYSLFVAREQLRSDFLLLESDLLYEQNALQSVQDSERRDCVLLSGLSHSHDEVFVETRNAQLVAMSKDRSQLHSVSGEFVGICRISRTLYDHMLRSAGEYFARDLHMDYETDCLAGLAASQPVYCRTVADLVWAEIDDLRHLERAERDISARLRDRDNQPSAATTAQAATAS
jgi:choline kinase